MLPKGGGAACKNRQQANKQKDKAVHKKVQKTETLETGRVRIRYHFEWSFLKYHGLGILNLNQIT